MCFLVLPPDQQEVVLLMHLQQKNHYCRSIQSEPNNWSIDSVQVLQKYFLHQEGFRSEHHTNGWYQLLLHLISPQQGHIGPRLLLQVLMGQEE